MRVDFVNLPPNTSDWHYENGLHKGFLTPNEPDPFRPWPGAWNYITRTRVEHAMEAICKDTIDRVTYERYGSTALDLLSMVFWKTIISIHVITQQDIEDITRTLHLNDIHPSLERLFLEGDDHESLSFIRVGRAVHDKLAHVRVHSPRKLHRAVVAAE